MSEIQNQNPFSAKQNQMNLQEAPPKSVSIESTQPNPLTNLENKFSALESYIKKTQNYEKPSELEMVKDLWKYKSTLFTYGSNYKLFAICIPSIIGLAGFVMRSKALRRALVKRYLVSTKKMNNSFTTRLNFIPRTTIVKEWDKIVNDEGCSKKILLIEGYQGTGKSYLIQKYIEEQSKVRPTIYISLRDVSLDKWKEEIGIQINFYPEIFQLFKDEYEYAPYCLKLSMNELQNSRWWFAPLTSFWKKKRPFLVIDDIQRLFKKKEYEEIQAFIINTILIPIRDKNQAAIFLLTSDYSIQDEISVLSGMSSRLKHFSFPKIDAMEFEKFMIKDLEKLKKYNPEITLECLIKFYEEFNSDLRSLNEFIEIYDGNYEETKSKLIIHEIDKVGKYLDKPNVFSYECEILFFLFEKKKLHNELFLNENKEVSKLKMNALQNLINENIIRQSSTKNKGRISEFHSPKYILAIKELLKK